MTGSVIETEPTPRMRALEENLFGHVTFVQERVPGMTVERRDGLWLVDSGLGSDTFNKILSDGLAEEGAEAAIDNALAAARGTGRPFAWWVGPGSRPLDLERRLSRRGLTVEERELGMCLDLDRAPTSIPLPTGGSIRSVTDISQLKDFATVLAHVWQPPDLDVLTFFERAADVLLAPDCPKRLFVGYLDGEPAATSELFLTDAAAGVYMVATSPAQRRRGFGMALTWTVLAEARQSGRSLGVLQASEAGQKVYERLGFEPCGHFVEYAVT